jgi:hypothetical protein
MPGAKRLGLIALAAALTAGAAPAAAAADSTPPGRNAVATTALQVPSTMTWGNVTAAGPHASSYTMFLPDGTPVRAAQPSALSFMDYTDDALLCFTVDAPIFSKEQATEVTSNTLLLAETLSSVDRPKLPGLAPS